MKNLLYAILLLTSLSATAQTDSTSRFSFGIAASGDYSYRKLKSDGTLTSDMIKVGRDDIERPKAAYTLGVKCIYRINDHFSLTAGLHFQDKGSRTVLIDYYNPTSDPDLPTKSRTNYHFYYLGMPIGAKFTFGKNMFRQHYITAGISPDIFLDYTARFRFFYADGSTKRKTEKQTYLAFYRITPVAVIGGGTMAVLNKSFRLEIQPTVRLPLAPAHYSYVREYPLSAGLEISFWYKQ